MFVQNNRNYYSNGDTRRTIGELPDVGTKLETWGLKVFQNFHFSQSDMVFFPLKYLPILSA